MNKITQVIAEKIRPILQSHQGDIELQEITPEGLVRVRLTGACASCPGAQHTLSEVVEAQLKEACPEVKKVVLVNGVSDDLIQQALKILQRNKQ
ncbi:MAG: NifU family protein [Desulfitobacteriia bacterium]|jgi:Fe-S cluster biogenesis protein NfuA